MVRGIGKSVAVAAAVCAAPHAVVVSGFSASNIVWMACGIWRTVCMFRYPMVFHRDTGLQKMKCVSANL